MKANKIIVAALCVALVLSLVGCQRDELVSTEIKAVDAFVTDTYHGRLGYGITVEYDGAKNDWENKALYQAYKNRLGNVIKCNMIIRTYKSGRMTKELVYSQDLVETECEK